MIETEFQTQSLRFAEGTSGARSPSKSRAKSSLRLKYEAETQVISRKLGDLESIRGQLGLSQRKMAQLLLVDPSAWTRWTKGNDEAPPHIYRMLQWYLALENKYPALDVNFWLNTVAQVTTSPELSKRAGESESELRRRLNGALAEIAELREMSLAGRLAVEASTVSLKKMISKLAIAAIVFGAIIGLTVALFLK